MVFAPPAITTEYVLVNGNSVKGLSSPSVSDFEGYSSRVLADVVGYDLEKLAKCESSNNPLVVILDSNNRYSYGLFQYQWLTWKSKMKEYQLAPYADDADLMNLIFDRNTQIRLTLLILRNEVEGWQHWYNCLK